MNRKNELRKSRIQRWLLVIAGLGSIGGLALSEPLAQQATSPPQATLISVPPSSSSALPSESRKTKETKETKQTKQTESAHSAALTPHASRPQLDRSYGQLPLSFEPNVGQTDDQVKFLSRGRGYTLFLTLTEAVLALRHKDPL